MRTLSKIHAIFLFACTATSVSGFVSKPVREAAEYLMKHFGKDVGEKGFQNLAEEISGYSAKYGDDAIEAIQKLGPRSFQLMDDAGENAPEVIRLINRYGNEAVWVASKPGNLAIFIRHGDDAAKAMIKHPGIAAPVINEFGVPAAKALQGVTTQNARRVAMMVKDQSLAASGKAAEYLDVISRFGDGAAEWIWRHKGSIAVVAVATGFLADPEPFLKGAMEVVKIGGETIVRPVISEGAKAIDWNLVAILIISVGGVYVVLRKVLPLRMHQSDSA